MDESDFNTQVIDEFRANDGKVGGMFKNSPMILINSTGARTGAVHTIPLVYTKDGENYVVIASKGGAPTNPDWYYNLKAHPVITVEVGPETINVVAREEFDDSRQRLYDAQAALMPNFAEYQQNTDRVIPLFTLRPEPQ